MLYYYLIIHEVIKQMLIATEVERIGPQTASSMRTPDSTRYDALVAGLAADDPSAAAELNDTFGSGVRFFLGRGRPVGADPGSLTDQCMLSVQQQVRSGGLQHPSELPSLVLKVAKRLHKGIFSAPGTVRREEAEEALAGISETGREALLAFFVDGEASATICARLKITEFAFRSIKDQTRLRFRAIIAAQRPTPGLKLA
jgi:hypothetical protein